MKKYTAPAVEYLIVETEHILKDSNRHDQGVGDDRGHGYHDDWEHRENPWDKPEW